MLLLPVLAFFSYLKLEEGIYWTYSILDFDLALVRADPMSLMFLNIFIIATFIAVIYNSHEKGTMEHFSGLLYAGSGVGVVMAGDLITFFNLLGTTHCWRGFSLACSAHCKIRWSSHAVLTRSRGRRVDPLCWYCIVY